jgi:hypothetical protein
MRLLTRKPKMVTLTVDVPEAWFRAAQRSWILFPISALTGAVPTFAPGYVYYLGRSGVSPYDWRVITCCVLVYALALFYGRLASGVVTKAWNARKRPAAPA